MKTVSGKIVSTKPVSLSKAANVLANFVTSDNGVSQPVAAYLRRASAAFDELVYFKRHRKLKKNSSKEENLTKSDTSHRSLEEYEVMAVENCGSNKKIDRDLVEVDEHRTKEVEGKSRKKEKKEKKRKKSEGSLGNKENDGIKVESKEDNETVKEKSEEKKRKKSEGSLGNTENDSIKVESKEDNETVNEKSEEKKKKKKRKNAEVDGGEMGNSVTFERKKRRKTKADD